MMFVCIVFCFVVSSALYQSSNSFPHIVIFVQMLFCNLMLPLVGPLIGIKKFYYILFYSIKRKLRWGLSIYSLTTTD